MVRPGTAVPRVRGQRAIASAVLDGGAQAVATRSGLAVLADAHETWSREWHEVDRGTWDDAAEALTVTWVDASAPAVLQFAGAAPRRFLTVLRERVQASVVHVNQVDFRSGGTARAAIRRTGDGTLLSQVIVDGQAGLTDDEWRAVAALEARVRYAVGLP